MHSRDLVTIRNTGSTLDGARGRLLGKSVNGLIIIWIVELIGETFFHEGEEYLAITLPSSCLEPNGAFG